MESKRKIAIIAGGTGKCGYYIIEELIKKNYIIRIITRNRENAKKVLGNLFKEIDEVFECDLFLEA